MVRQCFLLENHAGPSGGCKQDGPGRGQIPRTCRCLLHGAKRLALPRSRDPLPNYLIQLSEKLQRAPLCTYTSGNRTSAAMLCFGSVVQALCRPHIPGEFPTSASESNQFPWQPLSRVRRRAPAHVANLNSDFISKGFGTPVEMIISAPY